MKRAAADGVLVPVLGLEISALTDYGNAPKGTIAQEYGQDPGQPRCSQAKELHEVARRSCEMTQHLKVVPLDAQLVQHYRGEWKYEDPPRRKEMVEYLGQIVCAEIGDVQCAMGEHIDENERRFMDLKIDLVALALGLSRSWTQWLAAQSSPLSTIKSDDAAPDSVADENFVTIYLARSVDHAAALHQRQQQGLWAEPRDLHLEWVYEKLLLLASQIFSSRPQAFWLDSVTQSGDPEGASGFAGRHSEFVADHVGTNWRMKGQGGVPEVRKGGSAGNPGVRVSHVLWAESLIMHVLLSGTSAYRTIEQIAFLLSLDDNVADLPNLSADPFEVGLLYPQDRRDMEALRSLLRDAEVVDGGSRAPGAFHRAIARLMRQTIDHFDIPDPDASYASKRRKTGRKTHVRSEESPEQPSLPAQKQIIITMALDREMERALDEEFDAYRLLIPVWIPLKSESGELRSKAGWLHGEMKVVEQDGRRIGRCSEWIDVTAYTEDQTPKVSLVGDGPVLVKLFGSPLTDVRPEDFEAGTTDYDPTPRRGGIRPRVVLDESQLLRLLFGNATPMQVRGMDDALLKSRMFFFGQDAVTWSDRIPYLMMETLRGSEGATQDRLERDDDTVPAAGEMERVVAIGDRSTYGDSLFLRLRIARNLEDMSIRETALEIMKGVIDDGIR